MSEIKTGGPAFPQDIGWCSPNQHIQYRGPQGGMTMRDYFAAKAMQGIVTNPNASGMTFEDISQRAWMQADAMLKAREQ